MIEDLVDVTPFIRPFPDASDVFCEPVARYARHLHPLVSIDLSSVRSEWSGWIHVVSPIEPCEGYIGSATTAYHNDYQRMNWLAFKMEEGRYRLLGDFRYFQLENPADDSAVKETYPGQRAELEQYYLDQEASFAATREKFYAHGGLFSKWAKPSADGSYPKDRRLSLVAQIGGEAGNGNWASSPELFSINTDNEYDPRPMTPDGRFYEFVGGVTGYHYRSQAADSIVVFYDPQEKIALFTFDYT